MLSSQNASSSPAIDAISNRIDFDAAWDAAQFISVAIGLILYSVLCGSVSLNRGKWKDTIGIVTLVSALHWKTIRAVSSSQLPIQSYIYIIAVVSFQASVAFRTVQSSRSKQDRVPESTSESFLRPLIFPCRTTHTRFFPTKHSFGYSYLFVGIPIGWNESSGTLLSTEVSQAKTWFSVHSDDYLARGSVGDGLKSKLDAYLASQKVAPDEYPYAYLVTAPRFLGFSFNPISFWYLYDQHKTLAAMVLEVNNTFDERRMYFMKNNLENVNANLDFTNEWMKDFHVSPFNDRDGSYSVTAKNPAASLRDIRVDNNIVLRSDERKAKIVARVFSTEAAIDPTKLSILQSWQFLAQWWWVGFMTNPRILREARMLWVKKLQVYYRPEVLTSSIGRNESTEEAKLAPLLADYLQHLTSISPAKVSVEYIPAAGHDRDKIVYLGHQAEDQTSSTALRIKILTPAFYEELVKANSVCEAFEKGCFNSDPGTQMVETSDVASLRSLLQQAIPIMVKHSTTSTSTRLRALFRRGISRSNPDRQQIPSIKQKGVSAYSSDFDSFVLHVHPSQYPEYCNIAARILLADRIAFGFMPLLKLYTWLVWSVLGLAISHTAVSLLQQQWSVTACLSFTSALFVLHYLRGIWSGPGPGSL